jgi:hypothetical protein
MSLSFLTWNPSSGKPTSAALLSKCEQSWDVENPVILNKCLLNSQGLETKTSGMQVCLEGTGLFESLLRYEW